MFSEVELKMIEALAAYGVPQEIIAIKLGVSPKTLRANGREAYQTGKAIGIANVSKTAYEMAMSKKDGKMTRFYLRTQAGLREQRSNHNARAENYHYNHSLMIDDNKEDKALTKEEKAENEARELIELEEYMNALQQAESRLRTEKYEKGKNTINETTTDSDGSKKTRHNSDDDDDLYN
ncbi:MAG: hypothetical protein QE263_02080 [Vampirovibrionales bacterium]|nr:hypothetical protein [Vampirovibrionales bacterium]